MMEFRPRDSAFYWIHDFWRTAAEEVGGEREAQQQKEQSSVKDRSNKNQRISHKSSGSETVASISSPTSPLSSTRWQSSTSSTSANSKSAIKHHLLLVFISLFLLSLSTTGVEGQPKPRNNKAPVTRNFECKRNGCCDQHEWCKFWGSIGECDSNKIWMTPNCQITCSTCSAEGGSGSRRTVKTRKGERPTASKTRRPRTRSRTRTRTTVRTRTRRTRPAPRTAPRTQRPAPQTTRTRTTTRSQTVARQSSGPFNGPRTCSGIRQSGMSQAQDLVTRFGLTQSREDVRSRQVIGISNVFDSVSKFGCASSLRGSNCNENLCYHLKYRSFDGFCNNLGQPTKGTSFQPYKRLLPPIYDDGVSAPVATTRSRRPTPREACRFLLASPQQVLSNKFSAMLMQWGQFISHDLAKTHLHRQSDCSASCANVPGRCFNIEIQRSDPLSNALRGQGCFKMARSAATCGTGQNGRPREQFNENTPFLDASNVYGSSEDDHRRFRNGQTEFLQTTTRGNQQLPPHDIGKCQARNSCQNRLFQTGDDRANLFVGLAALHTLFIRQHNRIAADLKRQNPRWDGDRVFQESRKIVGALMQKITFSEWLPKILGSRMDTVIGSYRGYNPNVDPTIANEFTSSAFRFGHGMVQEIYDRLDAQGKVMNKLRVDDGINHPDQIIFGGGIDPILRGLMVVGAKRPQRITPAVTERMFGNTDLAATNIQRGRDHGIPPYNDWRAFCGLNKARTFEDFKNSIDLYIGAMLEDPVVGGMVGPTLACLLGDQFKRLRDGDRFWYQNPGTFTPGQLAEIEKMTLARVLCDNADRFDFVTRDAFHLTTGPNLVSCQEIPRINLQQWRE